MHPVHTGGQMTLAGTRVRPRTPRPGDAEARRRLGQHPEIVRALGRRAEPAFRELTQDEAQRWYQRLADASPHAWVVEVRGFLAGSARLHSLDVADRRARYAVGLLHPGFLGQGLGTEVTNLVLAYAFGTLNLHRVEVRVHELNERAIGCARRCGFVEEGRERESNYLGGRWYDDVLMGILEHEYRESVASPDPHERDEPGEPSQAKAK